MEVMEKELYKISTDINYDGHKFIPQMNSENGEVNGTKPFCISAVRQIYYGGHMASIVVGI